jgi:hypothetical protein
MASSFIRRHKIGLSIVIAIVAVTVIVLFWPITVYKTQFQSNIPTPSQTGNNPIYSIAESAASSNSSGDVSFNIQNFTYTSLDGTTKVSASSASMQISMTPVPQNMMRLNLNVQMTGLNIVSPTYSGKVGSAHLTGYVLVDPATNKLVVSLLGTTSISAIIQAALGF